MLALQACGVSGDALENRGIAGFDPERTRSASSEFEHILRIAVDSPGAPRFGFRVLNDAHHAAHPIDEQHVERDEGVFHPKRLVGLVVENEEHAVVCCQVFTKHQTAGALARRLGKLDLKTHVFRRGLDAHGRWDGHRWGG